MYPPNSFTSKGFCSMRKNVEKKVVTIRPKKETIYFLAKNLFETRVGERFDDIVNGTFSSTKEKRISAFFLMTLVDEFSKLLCQRKKDPHQIFLPGFKDEKPILGETRILIDTIRFSYRRCFGRDFSSDLKYTEQSIPEYMLYAGIGVSFFYELDNYINQGPIIRKDSDYLKEII